MQTLQKHINDLGLLGDLAIVGQENEATIENSISISPKVEDGDWQQIIQDKSVLSALIFAVNEPGEEQIALLFDSLSKFKPALFLHGQQLEHETVRDCLFSAGYHLAPTKVKDSEYVELSHPTYPQKQTFDVASYWENRYEQGGTSGAGSYDRLAVFKAKFINAFVQDKNIKSVLELGCGDGAQASLMNYPQYKGFDISPSVVERCQHTFRFDNTKHFCVYDAATFEPDKVKAEMAVSLDVIYHLSNDEVYEQYLNHLFASSSKYVVIYANKDNFSPTGVNERAGYVRFRNVLSDIKKKFTGWSLTSVEPNRFPFNYSDATKTSFADFYVFASEENAESDKTVSEQDWNEFRLKKILRKLDVEDEQVHKLLATAYRTEKTVSQQHEALTNFLTTHFKRQKRNTNDNYADLAAKLSEIIAELSSYSKGSGNLLQETSQSNERVSKSLSLLKDEFSQVPQIEKKISELSPQVKELELQISELKPQVTDVSSQVSEVKPQVEAIGSEVSALKPQLSDVVSQVSEFRPQVDAIESEVSRLKPVLNNIGPQVAGLGKHFQTISALQSELVAVLKEKSATQRNQALSELSIAGQQLSELESKYAKAVKEKEEYRRSFSYRAGKLIVDALLKPGLHTLSLPVDLVRTYRQVKSEPPVTLSSDNSTQALRHALDSQAKRLADFEPVYLSQDSQSYELCLEYSEAVTIEAAVTYGRQVKDKKKKAVFTIVCLDKNRKKIAHPLPKLSYSKKFKDHFKYIGCSGSKLVHQYSFVPPKGTVYVISQVNGFHLQPGEEVIVDAFYMSAGTSNIALPTSQTYQQSVEEPKSPKRFVPPSKAEAEISILGWPEVPDNGKLNVLAVMDEFTSGCFEDEVNLIQPRPDNWYALAEKYKPEFIFIESAWKGNKGSWQYRVAEYAFKPGNEIEQMCAYGREKGIPTIFWNKEDPVHHTKFMVTAKLVDHIFTTDANMIASYREKTGNKHVHALPFAAQPALHYPAPLNERNDRICFAGSWYGNRHAERGEAMRWLLEAAKPHGLDIYDRNFGTGNFTFPENLQSSVIGSLPYKELCAKQRKYRVFINVNSVTNSPTMFARRVFELMASGTPVVSTYSKGIEELFESDAVWMVKSKEEAEEAFQTLMTDDQEWQKRSEAGIKEVFAKHTYAHRLNQILEAVGAKSRVELGKETQGTNQ